MIGFLIFSLCAVRPYKFDISMIDQTFSSEFITHPTETQPVFDPLVPNKKERFWDPGGFLSEKNMETRTWRELWVVSLSVVGPKGLKYFRKRFPLRNFKRHKSKRMQRDSEWRIRAYENNWPMNNEP